MMVRTSHRTLEEVGPGDAPGSWLRTQTRHQMSMIGRPMTMLLSNHRCNHHSHWIAMQCRPAPPPSNRFQNLSCNSPHRKRQLSWHVVVVVVVAVQGWWIQAYFLRFPLIRIWRHVEADHCGSTYRTSPCIGPTLDTS